MGLFRKIGSFLRFVVKDEELNKDEEENDPVSKDFAAAAQHLPRKGFSVSVQVPVDKPPPGSLLVPCSSGDGGVQGFKWYAKCLRIDEDGDIADELLEEVLPEKHVNEQAKPPLPRFQVKYNTWPLKIRNQILSIDGKIQMAVESQGRLAWV